MKFPCKTETYYVLGACFEVYNTLGCGFLESVYQECLEIECRERSIPFQSQPRLEVFYRDKPLHQVYVPDLICYGKVILELKATKRLGDEHRAQIINYLKASRIEVGLLVNFGDHPKLYYQRFIHSV